MRLIFAVSLYYLFCFAALKSNARQGDALTRLWNAKLSGLTLAEVDANLHDAFQATDDSNILQDDGLKKNDRIEKLPGQPNVGFAQYGGYVTVNAKKGRALYYYFVEAERSKQSKPLLLWLNGGPGCSSLGYGAMEELGPFRVNSDGKTLSRNPYAWNKVANVLFLESPAGVGFSYTNTTSELNIGGDKLTADDNYVFLVKWLQRFPEYKNRDFYVSGESYAGHYVPQLAQNILQHNKASKKMVINLKGIIIGNAAINFETDLIGTYDYQWTHALLSDENIDTLHKYCNFSQDATDEPSQCIQALQDASHVAVWPYNIYAPFCRSNTLTDKPKKQTVTTDPCIDNYVSAYLNTPEAQKSFHAKLGSNWTSCNDIMEKQWTDSPGSVLPVLKEVMNAGLRVWVYSGDVDMMVSVTSTKYSLKKLNLGLKTKFHPWFLDGEAGGYTQVYQGNLTFATVRGAGHEVPSYQPARALALIKSFLDGTPLPSNE